MEKRPPRLNEGRPSKYDSKYIESVSEYLAECVDTYTNGKLKVKIPTIEEFATYIDVNKTTLYEWQKDHPQFSNAIERIKTEQQTRLINSGLSNEYNSTIAKLMLSSNHGMREKSDTDITTGGERLSPLLVKIIGKDEDNGDTERV